MNTSMYEYIRTIVSDERLLFHEPMSKYTTFRVGGEAECMVIVQTEEELAKLIPYLNQIEQEYFILGNGSNLLVGDKGYRGIIVKLGGPMEDVHVEGCRVVAGAGALLSKTAAAARANSLTGMEFAAGIPGSMGGAIVMNAGAYDGEMKQIVESVRVMNRDGQIMTLDNDTMEFGYRTSIIKNRPFIVLEASLRLAAGDEAQIGARMEELARLRKSKQPLEYPSAGSTFKRPYGYFAGKLIMEAGLSGLRVGGAKVAEKHCGFVVNDKDATAADVAALIAKVQAVVWEKHGVRLSPEIRFLGKFD